ncbi:DUF721 domain-containing protein [Pseudomonas sp. LRF_L74]|uniref:DUF721 domain-containing protein n=1 Tax=Pseudomonas sp. LRF_L74 TaxID=3369422 RepID=UPI003F600160
MRKRPHTARSPISLLNQAKPLRAMLDQAQRLGHLQTLVDAQMEPAAREHCRVASWREGCLLILVSNGHWATRMHYQQRRLQSKLQVLPEFAGLVRLQIKVRPAGGQVAYVGHKATLSEFAADTLQSTAEGISDPRLREALERLAQKGRSQE